MNLSKLITPQVHIQDACLIQFAEENSINFDDMLQEIGKILATDDIKEFLEDYEKAFDLEHTNSESFEEFKDVTGTTSESLVTELNKWLSQDACDMITLWLSVSFDLS